MFLETTPQLHNYFNNTTHLITSIFNDVNGVKGGGRPREPGSSRVTWGASFPVGYLWQGFAGSGCPRGYVMRARALHVIATLV